MFRFINIPTFNWILMNITGATIKVGDKTTTTDASGSWIIIDLAEDSYIITATKEGHNFRSQSL